MTGISFNPNAGIPERPADERVSGSQHKKNETGRPGWSSEAGSVSISPDRYAKADAYSRTGQAVSASGTASAADAYRKTWQSIRPSIVDHEEYGSVIGEPKLSEKAAEYYKTLKSKFGNLDFVLVGRESLAAAKANANSYGNANHLVVLIDEDKLERMATDENFRKKYEAIIAQAQNGGSRLNRVASQNPNIMKIGVNTDPNGTGGFMAACLKGTASAQAKMAEKRAERKAEAKAAEKKAHKKHEAEKREERIEARREERAELREKLANRTVISDDDFDEYLNNDDYEIIYADTLEELITKLEAYNERMGYGAVAETTGQVMDYQA